MGKGKDKAKRKEQPEPAEAPELGMVEIPRSQRRQARPAEPDEATRRLLAAADADVALGEREARYGPTSATELLADGRVQERPPRRARR